MESEENHLALCLGGNNWPRLRRNILSRLRHHFPDLRPEDREDALQDAVTSLISASAKYARDNTDVIQRRIWVCARNRALDMMRYRARHVLVTLEHHEECVDSAADALCLAASLNEAMMQLGRQSFPGLTTIVFHDIYGFSFEEIAPVLRTTVAGALMHHHRAKRTLRRLLQETGTSLTSDQSGLRPSS